MFIVASRLFFSGDSCSRSCFAGSFFFLQFPPPSLLSVITMAAADTESDLLCPPERSPLCTPWSFWFDKKLQKENPTAEDYRNNMNLLGTFDTVEDFWRHFIHIQAGSKIPSHSNVYMFRNVDLPSWERWPEGGCWILKVKRKQGVLNKLWQDLVFACIGEEFQQYGVVGVMLASRKNVDMLSVWYVVVLSFGWLPGLRPCFEPTPPFGLLVPSELAKSDCNWSRRSRFATCARCYYVFVRTANDCGCCDTLFFLPRCARSDTKDRFRIGEKLKLILHLDVGAVLDYKRHQNSIQDGSSFKNAQSFVFAKKVRREIVSLISRCCVV